MILCYRRLVYVLLNRILFFSYHNILYMAFTYCAVQCSLPVLYCSQMQSIFNKVKCDTCTAYIFCITMMLFSLSFTISNVILLLLLYTIKNLLLTFITHFSSYLLRSVDKVGKSFCCCVCLLFIFFSFQTPVLHNFSLIFHQIFFIIGQLIDNNL